MIDVILYVALLISIKHLK